MYLWVESASKINIEETKKSNPESICTADQSHIHTKPHLVWADLRTASSVSIKQHSERAQIETLCTYRYTNQRSYSPPHWSSELLKAKSRLCSWGHRCEYYSYATLSTTATNYNDSSELNYIQSAWTKNVAGNSDTVMYGGFGTFLEHI